MARLVDAVLRATGYTTYLSPEGPDKGVDILAPEPMGFEEPRVCVQVKLGDSGLDRPTLDQPIGVMQNVQASHGLLVLGVDSSPESTEREPRSSSAFACATETINHVLEHYNMLDKDIRTELPLKRIWIVAEAGE